MRKKMKISRAMLLFSSAVILIFLISSQIYTVNSEYIDNQRIDSISRIKFQEQNISLYKLNDFQMPTRAGLNDLTPHAPVIIISDDNFTDYGFTGDGSEGIPYIIDGYNITTTADIGISIKDTTKYFEISNCYADAITYGIKLDSVASGTAKIANTTCENNLCGLGLDHCSFSTIIGNTLCNNEGSGLSFVNWATYNSAINNTCCWNNIGISVGFPNNLIGNNCSYNDLCGFHLYEGNGLYLENNFCSNNDYGIYGYHCSATIINNTFVNNLVDGIQLFDCYASSSFEIIGNNCSYNINNGFRTLGEMSGFLRIEKNVFSYNKNYGLNLLGGDTNNCIINENICEGNTYTGMSIGGESQTISRNICSWNMMSGLTISGDNSTITSNICSWNMMSGLTISGDNSTITSNICFKNTEDGIVCYSDYSLVTTNNCSFNEMHGINLVSPTYSNVTSNLLQNNTLYGVYIAASASFNKVYKNTFGYNKASLTSQGWDDGTSNLWYDDQALEGNFWSDWSGIAAYPIDGAAGSFDLYPNYIPVIVEFQKLFIFVLTLAIVPVVFKTIYSKKRRSNSAHG